MPGEAFVLAQSQQAPVAATKIPPEQLDSLVAPIALYSDPLLAQTLAASTYPLEIIQLQQWLQKNKNLKEKELADTVAKQQWIQAYKRSQRYQTLSTAWPMTSNGPLIWEMRSLLSKAMSWTRCNGCARKHRTMAS
jgi:hypothetical protein